MNTSLSNLVTTIRETDWKELADLFAQYPYSQTITDLMSAKAFSENSLNLDNPGHKTFIKANNPGIQFANLIRNIEELAEHDLSVKQVTRNTDYKDTSIEQSTDEISQPIMVRQEIPETAPKKTGSLKKQAEKSIPGTPVYQSDFTKWLLRQDAVKQEDTVLETLETKAIPHLKTPDSNQLREEIVSEPLAELYVQQGLIKEAIEMYMKLSLKIPNKSTYFAEIIKKLKKSN